FPDVLTIAEESTSWPGVTHPVQQGGLGFDMKWMMGWMHDSLNYFQKEPVFRRYHHGQLTFSLVYAFSEKFCLPLSHDEVVHGKASLINKMPGDAWQKAANLRLLYAYVYGHPGAKLIFMGRDIAQAHEWPHDYSLDWHENHQALNKGIQLLLKDLNELYKTPAMHQLDFSPEGFRWIDCCDADRSILSWIRKGERAGDELLFVANFTAEVRHNYRVGVPVPGFYEEILNSDNLKYGGSDVLNEGDLEAFPVSVSGFTHSLSVLLPPLGLAVFKFSRENPD